MPDRDADWETGDAFDDQLHRHDSCDADTCLCPSGRKFDEEDTEWEIMLCVLCGAQGIHVECGGLDRTRPRWKCPLCKPVVASLSNQPISVFTRVKRADNPPNRQFSRTVFDNLTFKVNTETYQINVDLHKNRKDPKDPVLVSFKVDGVPAFDIPKPVKLHKPEPTVEKNSLRNIPCPHDHCEVLLSRAEFKEHCLTHKKASVEELKESEARDGNYLSTDQNTQLHKNNIDSDEIKNDDVPSVDQIDERRESSQSDKTPTKQSSIFNFFNLFSPKSPEFEKPPRKRIKLDKMGSSIQDTPPRVENTDDVIISSPVGFFKVDDNSHIGSPKRPVLAEQSHRQVNL